MSSHQSSKRSIKVQITLPEEVLKKIEDEIRESYSSKSFWFLKIVNEYFEQKEKKKKSVISLNIK